MGFHYAWDSLCTVSWARQLACWVVLEPDGPPYNARKPVHHNSNVEGSNNDAAGAEAEFLTQVGDHIDESEGVALAAAPYPSQTQQPVMAQHVRAVDDAVMPTTHIGDKRQFSHQMLSFDFSKSQPTGKDSKCALCPLSFVDTGVTWTVDNQVLMHDSVVD